MEKKNMLVNPTVVGTIFWDISHEISAELAGKNDRLQGWLEGVMQTQNSYYKRFACESVENTKVWVASMKMFIASLTNDKIPDVETKLKNLVEYVERSMENGETDKQS